MFINALKAFKKPFEAPQRSMKIKIEVYFYFNTILCNAREGEIICDVTGGCFNQFQLKESLA